MTVPRTFLFEGQMLTVRQVHALVPAYSLGRIGDLLKRGMTTKQEMLCRPAQSKGKGGGWIDSNRLMYAKAAT